LLHQTYTKRQVALRQIETALRLFEEQDDLISVVTLAGAAEEILGKLVKREGQTNALDSLSSAAHAMYQYLFGGEPLPPKHFADRANIARNAFKHLRTAGGDAVTLDLREEAVDMLTRAIDNYWYLETNLTPAMERFCRSQRFTESASDL
jgi:hypothetical protein